MTRATLRADIKEYLHRENDIRLTDSRLDQFINDANRRIARDLRSQRNVINTTISIVAGIGTLPDQVYFVQSLSYNGCEIPSSTKANASGITTGTTPLLYTISNTQLRVYPAVTITADIQYFRVQEIAAGDSGTNNSLTSFPYLYRWACLAEAAVYTQDEPMFLRYSELYGREVEAHNLAARDRRAPHTFSRFFLQRRGVRGT